MWKPIDENTPADRPILLWGTKDAYGDKCHALGYYRVESTPPSEFVFVTGHFMRADGEEMCLVCTDATHWRELDVPL